MGLRICRAVNAVLRPENVNMRLRMSGDSVTEGKVRAQRCKGISLAANSQAADLLKNGVVRTWIVN